MGITSVPCRLFRLFWPGRPWLSLWRSIPLVCPFATTVSPPSVRAADPVLPEVRLSSYTRSFGQTNDYSCQSLDTNGAVASRWDYRWINQNDVNWSLAQGGTETYSDAWAMSWSPQAPPNSYTWDSRTSKVWPASPGTGTQTNIYHSGNWVYDSDLSSLLKYSLSKKNSCAKPNENQGRVLRK